MRKYTQPRIIINKLLVVPVLFLFVGCTSTDDQKFNFQNASNIIGSVKLYDEGTTAINNSDMIVSIEGTTYNAVTDTLGNFTLKDVPYGTYTLNYEKSGFGAYKVFDLEHSFTGSSTIITDVPSLGKISKTEISDLSTTSNSTDLDVLVTTNPSGSINNRRYIRYFISEDSNVSSIDYKLYSPTLISRINPYTINISKNDLLSAGFSSGQTVYIKIYGDSFWSNAYDNPFLNRRVFPNLNLNTPSSTSFIIP